MNYIPEECSTSHDSLTSARLSSVSTDDDEDDTVERSSRRRCSFTEQGTVWCDMLADFVRAACATREVSDPAAVGRLLAGNASKT